MNEKELISEIEVLRKILHEKETNLNILRKQNNNQLLSREKHGLNNEEITRYSRQILIPEISVKGQVRIKNSSILIVGAGGLGCPSALYLAGAGIGCIGIVDYDHVEINNLHRQLLYSECDIGIAKVDAAASSIKRLNSNVQVIPYKIQLDSSNALDIVKKYDIVIDATDNVPTRYLLNDACVLTGKPLVSGSALKMEGQLSVFNYNGPCYRCIFPKPPPPETVTNCGDGGVLGAVVGTIGLLQAVEALKIILDIGNGLSGRLLLYDGSESLFKNVRLRSKVSNCDVCGKSPTIKNLIDYELFCHSKANDKNPNLRILNNNERVTVNEYNDITNDPKNQHLLIDVRSPEEFEICQIDNSLNVPFVATEKNYDKWQNLKRSMDENKIKDVYVVCRRGNDSQRAVNRLKEVLQDPSIRIRDIVGGIHAWAREIDPTFPIY